MKFKLCYDSNDIAMTELYLAVNNSTAINRSYKDIFDLMLRIARQNAVSVIEDDDNWTTCAGTAGYMIIFSHEGFSKKDYPIIRADIYVSPTFEVENYVEENFEI